MRQTALATACFAVMLSSNGRAQGLPAVELAHEGWVLGANDEPLDNPAQSLRFRIYDALDQVQWEGTCVTAVTRGYYAVRLGGTCGAAFDTSVLPLDEARFLEVAVGTVALSPRLKLTAAPSASQAANAARFGGLLPSAYWKKSEAVEAATLGGQSLAALDGRYARIDGSGVITNGRIGWANVDNVPAGLADGDQVGLTSVATSGAISGSGAAGDPVVLAAAGVTHTHLASDAASLAKVSANLLSAAPGLLGVNGLVQLATDSATSCGLAQAGSLRWNGTAFEGCDGTGSWKPLTLGTTCVPGKISYATPGTATFSLPAGCTTARVLVVGGGGGGAVAGDAGGGGSGHARKGTYTLSTSITVTVGAGGGTNGAGTASSFGALLSASGGSPGSGCNGGAGGSGGGNCNGSIAGYDGGTGGAAGGPPGGAGGNFDSGLTSTFTRATVAFGAGGAAGCGSGGGGGGIVVDGSGGPGGRGTYATGVCPFGGNGFGGGGSGGRNTAGAGASGVVYVEWTN